MSEIKPFPFLTDADRGTTYKNGEFFYAHSGSDYIVAAWSSRSLINILRPVYRELSSDNQPVHMSTISFEMLIANNGDDVDDEDNIEAAILQNEADFLPLEQKIAKAGFLKLLRPSEFAFAWRAQEAFGAQSGDISMGSIRVPENISQLSRVINLSATPAVIDDLESHMDVVKGLKFTK